MTTQGDHALSEFRVGRATLIGVRECLVDAIRQVGPRECLTEALRLANRGVKKLEDGHAALEAALVGAGIDIHPQSRGRAGRDRSSRAVLSGDHRKSPG